MRKGGSPAQKSSYSDTAEMSWELKLHELEGFGSTLSALKPQKGHVLEVKTIFQLCETLLRTKDKSKTDIP